MRIKILSISQQENGNIIIETSVPLRYNHDVYIDSRFFDRVAVPREMFLDMHLYKYRHVDGVLTPHDVIDINNKLIKLSNDKIAEQQSIMDSAVSSQQRILCFQAMSQYEWFISKLKEIKGDTNLPFFNIDFRYINRTDAGVHNEIIQAETEEDALIDLCKKNGYDIEFISVHKMNVKQ